MGPAGGFAWAGGDDCREGQTGVNGTKLLRHRWAHRTRKCQGWLRRDAPVPRGAGRQLSWTTKALRRSAVHCSATQGTNDDLPVEVRQEKTVLFSLRFPVSRSRLNCRYGNSEKPAGSDTFNHNKVLFMLTFLFWDLINYKHRYQTELTLGSLRNKIWQAE